MIYINIFVHYPETYNETIVSNIFKEYFKDNNLYVKVKSAPSNENEMIVVKTDNQEEDLLKLKEFIFNHFQIKDILINI